MVFVGKWQIEDVVGNDEITIHRKFGNEQYVALYELCRRTDLIAYAVVFA
jgi:hypothetical protein